ncbi:MAG: uL22 family ribosomal protein [Candidatus Pacearchaeota archaeon]
MAEEQKQNKQAESQESSQEATTKKAVKKTASSEEKTQTQKTESSSEGQEKSGESQDQSSGEDKSTTKKAAKKKAEKKEEKPKKDYAIANGWDLPISPKYARDICKFIRGLPIEKAINKLEEVEKKVLAVPMKGEYGHKKHAKKFASGSGKYPQKATRELIKLLKNLSANSISNGLEKPIISEARSNVGSRPMARFGMWKRKRAHVKLIAKEKSQKGKKKTKSYGGNSISK